MDHDFSDGEDFCVSSMGRSETPMLQIASNISRNHTNPI